MDISNVSGIAVAAAASSGGFNSVPNPANEDRHALIQAVRAVNGAELFGNNNELSFIFDRNLQRAVVRIVDKKTRTVVQQIPSEQVVRLAEELKQRV